MFDITNVFDGIQGVWQHQSVWQHPKCLRSQRCLTASKVFDGIQGVWHHRGVWRNPNLRCLTVKGLNVSASNFVLANKVVNGCWRAFRGHKREREREIDLLLNYDVEHQKSCSRLLACGALSFIVLLLKCEELSIMYNRLAYYQYFVLNTSKRQLEPTEASIFYKYISCF